MSRAARSSALAFALVLLMAAPASASTLSLQASQFGGAPTFSFVRNFEFTIDVVGPLAPGVYVDPTLSGVDYRVFGRLASGTPSGFTAFDLQRSITGPDFYAQGSSLAFEIALGADLSDGLQLSELVGDDGVFVLNAREVGTGRYHPALLELNADGTGLIRNSNNFGGINPATMQMVDVQIGDEYVTALTFDPTTLTLVVPEPSTALLLAFGLGGLAVRSRR